MHLAFKVASLSSSGSTGLSRNGVLIDPSFCKAAHHQPTCFAAERQTVTRLDLYLAVEVVGHDLEARPGLLAREDVVQTELARKDVFGEVASRCLGDGLGRAGGRRHWAREEGRKAREDVCVDVRGSDIALRGRRVGRRTLWREPIRRLSALDACDAVVVHAVAREDD